MRLALRYGSSLSLPPLPVHRGWEFGMDLFEKNQVPAIPAVGVLKRDHLQVKLAGTGTLA